MAKTDAPEGFPEYLRHAGQNWSVEYTDCVDKSEHLLGACEGFKRKLIVDTDQDRESMIDTLIHEFGHAVVRQSGLELAEEVEEAFAVMFATGFLSLVRDNEAFWEEE